MNSHDRHSEVPTHPSSTLTSHPLNVYVINPVPKGCRRMPCRARGVPSSRHTRHSAFFDIPDGAPHGMPLLCSDEACVASGRRFRFCQVCDMPVARRNFQRRHSHHLLPDLDTDDRSTVGDCKDEDSGKKRKVHTGLEDEATEASARRLCQEILRSDETATVDELGHMKKDQGVWRPVSEVSYHVCSAVASSAPQDTGGTEWLCEKDRVQVDSGSKKESFMVPPIQSVNAAPIHRRGVSKSPPPSHDIIGFPRGEAAEGNEHNVEVHSPWKRRQQFAIHPWGGANRFVSPQSKPASEDHPLPVAHATLVSRSVETLSRTPNNAHPQGSYADLSPRQLSWLKLLESRPRTGEMPHVMNRWMNRVMEVSEPNSHLDETESKTISSAYSANAYKADSEQKATFSSAFEWGGRGADSSSVDNYKLPRWKEPDNASALSRPKILYVFGRSASNANKE